GYLTEYWTIFEKNTRVPGLEGFVLWNRVLWLAVAATLGVIAWWKFRMGHAAAKSRASAEPKETAKTLGVSVRLPLLVRMTLLQFVETVKNIYFAVIVLAGIGFMIASARSMGSMYGTNTYPVTYQVLELVGGTFSLFMLIIITFYSGE